MWVVSESSGWGTHQAVWTRVWFFSHSRTCKYMTMICNQRGRRLQTGGWTKLLSDSCVLLQVTGDGASEECVGTHLVGMLDVDTEAQLLQHSSLCFDDLVFGIYVVLIKYQ